ncbi:MULTISPECIES: hypothetical protein [unclassified Halorubrum]|uniref:hypothetical protein n=1 Tax=unclassified Halorubrum TaxID=2642239 RepID=UPI00190B2BED|nr:MULTISPECIES: hypothetical protein [unclassified Halorubrum]
MRYEWKHVRPDEDGGFDVAGRVVHVAVTSSDPTRGAYLLVQTEDRRNIPSEFAEGSEGVDLYAAGSDEPVATIEEDPTCAGKGGECSRRVENPGDRCWQHPEDE